MEEAPAIRPSGGAGILLVEDDGSVREILARGLIEQGFPVVSAKDAEEALVVFRSVQASLELLITDVVLPGRDGHELARDLLRAKPELKVLFISGYSREELLARGLDPEARVVEKPIGFEDLAEEARRILGSGGETAKRGEA